MLFASSLLVPRKLDMHKFIAVLQNRTAFWQKLARLALKVALQNGRVF